MHRSGLTELEVVMAVVRRGSFRGAAQELGMSTTAVSNAIAGLESRLETRLYTLNVSTPWQGRAFVYDNALWFYHPELKSVVGWELEQ